MTLLELQIIVNLIDTNIDKLAQSVAISQKFTKEAKLMINGQFASTVNVDAFVAIQTPLYVDLLTKIETDADNLGTDPFH